MQLIKKHKKLITMLTAVLLIAVSLGTYVRRGLPMTHGTAL